MAGKTFTMKIIYPLVLLLIFSKALNAQEADQIYTKAKSFYFTQPDSVAIIADQLESLAMGDEIHLNRARAFHLRGVLKQLRSESDTALKLFNKMEHHARLVPDSTLLSIALLSKGLMLVNMGSLDSAMEYYISGEKVAQLIGAQNYQARAMAEVARIFSMKGDHEAALTKYRDYYQLVKDSKNPNDLATAYAYIGAEFMFFHDHDSSLYYLNKALAIQKQINNVPGIAAAQLNKGSVFQEQNMLDSAIYYYENARENYRKARFTQGLGQLNLNIGSLHLNNGNAAEAIYALKMAISDSKMIKDLHAVTEEHRLLAKAYSLQGDHELAFNTLTDHLAFKDSLFSLEKENTIQELETRYETEKKEQQIAIQQAEIAEQDALLRYNLVMLIGLSILALSLIAIILLVRSRARKKHALMQKEAQVKLKETQIEAAISSQEKERSRFAKDLHDGFGQMISILNLNLQSLEKKQSNPHEVFDRSTKVLDEMYQELKSICFNLMPQTLIKKGIPAALNEFALRINTTGQKQVITDFHGLDDRLTDLQEISLYRISQEWVNNVLKYSDAQKITIQITKDENEITLLIEDDGVGFDLQLLVNGRGNGWRNMNSRINLIGGTLEVDTQPGRKGSALIINAPMTEIDSRQVEYDAA